MFFAGISDYMYLVFFSMDGKHQIWVSTKMLFHVWFSLQSVAKGCKAFDSLTPVVR